MNPGSAGPRRFKLPIGVGELLIDGREVMPRVVELQGQAGALARAPLLLYAWHFIT